MMMGLNDVVQFQDYIEKVQDRVKTLNKRVDEVTPDKQKGLLLGAVENLNIALEELRVAEEELRDRTESLASARHQVDAERRRYQELFDFAPDGYLIIDSQGKILEANRTAATMLNISRFYLVGKVLASFVPEAARRAFRQQMNQLLNLSQEWELEIQPRDRSSFHAALTVAPILEGEEAIAYRVCLRDITPRIQAEAKLRDVQLQNLQLLEAARLKTQFLSLLSHELRSPMNIITGFSQLLMRQPDPLSPKQSTMVERIFKSGSHLSKLINDLLDFSKLDSGRFELHPQELDLVELVHSTLSDLSSLAAQKCLNLNISTNLNNPIAIHDRTRLQQVLINLVSNAIKFTDTGDIWVEAWEQSPDRIAIAIRDTGIGIAPEDVKSIFKEFYQADQLLTRRYGGTGLGLTISDSLIKKMNGQITVESQLGQGSTFQVELPRVVR